MHADVERNGQPLKALLRIAHIGERLARRCRYNPILAVV